MPQCPLYHLFNLFSVKALSTFKPFTRYHLKRQNLFFLLENRTPSDVVSCNTFPVATAGLINSFTTPFCGSRNPLGASPCSHFGFSMGLQGCIRGNSRGSMQSNQICATFESPTEAPTQALVSATRSFVVLGTLPREQPR